LIGLLLVTQDLIGIDASVISSVILILLYIKGPINQLVGALPMFVQAEVALHHISALTEDLVDTDLALDDAQEYGRRPVTSIELRNVSYVFAPTEPADDGFALGPVNLTIEGGETLFIIGENGSGKTTLIKLLLGLYRPTSGTLLFNGEPVRDEELDSYRQHFSAVFSDYFLFENLLAEDASSGTTAVEYLERMEIAHKVALKDNNFSTIDLSTGQRKRLALIHAYIEQRPIIMLDEWAADQDPAFRRSYYTELLPELKAQGKTLIIVSHDDRYFEAADRVIRLESGKIAEDKRLIRHVGIATAAQVSCGSGAHADPVRA
jgi:putative pyoverdin transport system ATP-binding/permease protein